MKEPKHNNNNKTLDERIRQWMRDNPERAQAGERMLEQLNTVRTEFSGETAVRLEALVDETLKRQITIDNSRREGLKAANELRESMQNMAKTMGECLKTAKKAHRTAIDAVAAAMASRAENKIYVSPPVLTPSSKLN